MSVALSRLLRDHNQLRNLGSQLGEMMLLDTPPVPDVLAKIRWELGSLMMRHLAYEDTHLYIKLEKDRRPGVAAKATAMQAELKRMIGLYSEHVQQWTPERIAADWLQYRGAVRLMLSRLLRRIEQEENELFAFIDAKYVDLARAETTRHNWAREAWVVHDIIHGHTSEVEPRSRQKLEA